jgi:hypothetical protein
MTAAYVALLEEKEEELRLLLARAAYVADHLMDMIDRETWRESGAIGPEGQYEGDYHQTQVAMEIKRWKEIAGE